MLIPYENPREQEGSIFCDDFFWRAIVHLKLKRIANTLLLRSLPIWIRLRRSARRINSDAFLDRSIVVCAHPDDEILWFSSILCQVDTIILCYQNVRSNPLWSEGRIKSLSKYPMSNVVCLEIDESEVFDDDNYQDPVLTDFGLRIINDSESSERYKENYYKIKDILKIRLAGYRNVFTHNPWGEYGNEEHVQIYKVVKDLQKELKFDIWFSNYCSVKAIMLFKKISHQYNGSFIRKRTDRIVFAGIKNIYKMNRCWTWFDSWSGFKEEFFIKDSVSHHNGRDSHYLLPLNMMMWKEPVPSLRGHK